MTKKLIITLGYLAGIGPFVTDFYLPCLPTIASDFATSISMVQMSLTASMIGLAAGQLFIGPLSDKFGRRTPLLLCIYLFIGATIGCVLSPNIESFIFFRLLQGVAGAGGLVISKVYITDSFSGKDVVKTFAILASVQSITPILAPVLGSITYSISTWQGVFVVLGLLGLILLALCYGVKESLPKEQRIASPVWKLFTCYRPIIGNRDFMMMSVALGCSTGVLFAYIAASPFIFQNNFGLDSIAYGLCFAFNACGLLLGSILAMRLPAPVGLRLGTIGLFVTSGLCGLSLVISSSFVLFEILAFATMLCCGIIFPIITTYALQSEAHNRGTSSALLGAMTFGFGGIAAPLVGIGDLKTSTAITMIILAFGCLSCSVWYMRTRLRLKLSTIPIR